MVIETEEALKAQLHLFKLDAAAQVLACISYRIETRKHTYQKLLEEALADQVEYLEREMAYGVLIGTPIDNTALIISLKSGETKPAL